MEYISITNGLFSQRVILICRMSKMKRNLITITSQILLIGCYKSVVFDSFIERNYLIINKLAHKINKE